MHTFNCVAISGEQSDISTYCQRDTITFDYIGCLLFGFAMEFVMESYMMIIQSYTMNTSYSLQPFSHTITRFNVCHLIHNLIPQYIISSLINVKKLNIILFLEFAPVQCPYLHPLPDLYR